MHFGGGAPLDLYEGLRFGKLILYLTGGRSCLRNACNLAKIKYEECLRETEESSRIAEIRINDETIASGHSPLPKVAKLDAYKQAVLMLQTHCYSIKVGNNLED